MIFKTKNQSPMDWVTSTTETALESDLPPRTAATHTSLPGDGVGRCARRGLWDKPFGVPIGNGP